MQKWYLPVYFLNVVIPVEVKDVLLIQSIK